MEGLTPRHGSWDRTALSRTTDHARLLLRRALLALGALAVLIAAAVGVAATATAPVPAASTVAAELLEPARAPEVAVAGSGVPTLARWIDIQGAPRVGRVWAAAGLPTGATVAVATDERGAVVDPQHLAGDTVATGLAAGFGTLALCWGLLAVGVAVWRSRLAARDSRAWAREWAGVEPVWSRRGR